MARVGRGGKREDGAQALFKLPSGIRRAADAGDLEHDGVVAIGCDRGVLGGLQQAVEITGVASQRKRGAAAQDNPDLVREGEGFGQCEEIRCGDAGGAVLRGGGADEFGRTGDAQVGREQHGAGRRFAEGAA